MNQHEFILQMREVYPTKDWDTMLECDRALNWELWHGPLPSNYWTYVEPLEYYVWAGFEAAENYLRSWFSDLPQYVYIDDMDFVHIADPEADDENWDDEFNYIGPTYEMVSFKKMVLYKEVYNQIGE